MTDNSDDAPTESEIRTRLESIADPEIGRSLGELKMLAGVRLAEGSLVVTVDLPTPAYPGRERLTAAIRAAIEALFPDTPGVEVDYQSTVRGREVGGAAGLRVKNIIAVGSGKGGVGKSTVAAALAFGLQSYGAVVGLMDADVYGPSLPHLVGVTEAKPAAIDHKNAEGETFTRIEPVIADGVKVISMGFFVEPKKAVVWRGPMLHRAITQFLTQTDWGELDYLIIDMPPGTGDVSLTLSQSVPLAGAVVVCTPQQVALLDAVKAINMFQQVKIPVLGMVENMAGDIFGRGGAKAKAEELGVRFLGELPIDAEVRKRGDEGRIASLLADDSPVRPALRHITEQTAMQVARDLLISPQMPTLEVL